MHEFLSEANVSLNATCMTWVVTYIHAVRKLEVREEARGIRRLLRMWFVISLVPTPSALWSMFRPGLDRLVFGVGMSNYAIEASAPPRLLLCHSHPST